MHEEMNAGDEITVTTIRRLVAVLLVIVVSGVLACDKTSEATEQNQPEENPEYHSPFYIEGQGALHFETISFTDVGLVARESRPADTLMLEAIARSLAYELSDREALGYRAEVGHDPSLKDPSNHLYCEREHLYIALWRGYAPERWGYSLWSGCHEQQRFEWKELRDPHSEDVDEATRVEPLTESIADSIEEAHDRECFTRTC